jgi:hypothetical protein
MTSQEILIKAKLIEAELAKLTTQQRKYFVISKNFKWYECWSGAVVNGHEVAKYVEPPRELWLNAIRHFLNMQLVADYLAIIFNKYVPVAYNSFYRTKFWNSYGDNNGSANSLHKTAEAGDTKPLHITLAMWKYALIIAKLCPDLNGFKSYGSFVHADMRDDFKIYK